MFFFPFLLLHISTNCCDKFNCMKFVEQHNYAGIKGQLSKDGNDDTRDTEDNDDDDTVNKIGLQLILEITTIVSI